MPLERLIDLIAEVAVKRTTQKGGRESENSEAVPLPYWIYVSFQPLFQVLRVLGIAFSRVPCATDGHVLEISQ